MHRRSCLGALAVALVACGPSTPYARVVVGGLGQAPARLVAVVCNRYPHPGRCFTEGLAYHAGRLYESCGPSGEGAVQEVRLGVADALRRVSLDAPNVFPEGLASNGAELIQLTQESGFAWRWSPATLSPTGQIHPVEGVGRGLAFDGTVLISTDDSGCLFRRDPSSLRQVAVPVHVSAQGRPLGRLNELEFAAGRLYANVSFSTDIVRIDPATGTVDAIVDASAVADLGGRPNDDDVLNGIAWNPARPRRFILAGKRWAELFEVEFVPAPAVGAAAPTCGPTP